MPNNSFMDIIAWKKAHELVISIYQVTEKLPEFERRGLWSQMTRSAVSIPANIAEGFKKLSKADKLRFLNIAQGSLEECRHYILLSFDLKYITETDFNLLTYKIEGASYYLNSYAHGIQNDTGIKD